MQINKTTVTKLTVQMEEEDIKAAIVAFLDTRNVYVAMAEIVFRHNDNGDLIAQIDKEEIKEK